MQWPDNLKNSIQKEAAGKKKHLFWGKKRVPLIYFQLMPLVKLAKH